MTQVSRSNLKYPKDAPSKAQGCEHRPKRQTWEGEKPAKCPEAAHPRAQEEPGLQASQGEVQMRRVARRKAHKTKGSRLPAENPREEVGRRWQPRKATGERARAGPATARGVVRMDRGTLSKIRSRDLCIRSHYSAPRALSGETREARAPPQKPGRRHGRKPE